MSSVQQHFVRVCHKLSNHVVTVYSIYTTDGTDIMKRGGRFRAVLLPNGMWSTREEDAIKIIDHDISKYIEENFEKDGYGVYRDPDGHLVHGLFLRDSSTKKLQEFNNWMNNLPMNFNEVPLDTELTFKSDTVTPDMYRTKRLPYDLVPGSIDGYQGLMTVIYDKVELEKIEWCIGAVLSGESKSIEKLLVLYGDPGAGKSTMLDLIKRIFAGYWVPFVASELASASKQFGTAAFKDNPLVAIQDDGSLAKIESPVINEIVSHKEVVVNVKNVAQFTIKSNAFLFLATNDPVDIHNTKLGITRRLLDVYPSGHLVPIKEYERLSAMMCFETGSIAYHCLQVYKKLGKHYYLRYVPERMIRKTNYLYNFLFDKLDILRDREYLYRDELYSLYKEYCDDSGLGYPPKRIVFGEQLREYFDEYEPVKWIDGRARRHVYTGLKILKIAGVPEPVEETKSTPDWLVFSSHNRSVFDDEFKDIPAQYPNDRGTPKYNWASCKTTLKDINPTKLHWFVLPDNIIKIDFDLKDEQGKKKLDLSAAAASKFPPTYAEVSQSGNGIHLYYRYAGNADDLSRVFDKNIEVKVHGSHRRILTRCNDLPIRTISDGLPLKGGKPVFNEAVAQTEQGLRTTISKCIAKGVHGDTTSNVDWICECLRRAHDSGLTYDVTDMFQDCIAFAQRATNQSEGCTIKIKNAPFKSESTPTYSEDGYTDESLFMFFDFEVFPNLIVLCWKYLGDDYPVNAIMNPTSKDIAEVFGIGKQNRPKAIGYNNKGYDNYIAYAIYTGKSIPEVYYLSRAIVNGDKYTRPENAKHLSYTDIFDFLPDKISLKKWEHVLKTARHEELPLRWDQDVPKEMWPAVVEYCKNDVLSTEALFLSKYGQAGFKARNILVDLANIIMGPGSTCNDSTNDLTTKLIVGNEENPQQYYAYPNLAEEFPGYEYCATGIDPSRYLSKDVIISGKSIYRGYDPGEGGFVFARPGMYGSAECDDSASHHPHTILIENGFGPLTKNFKMLLDLRMHIKHKEYDIVREMFNGALSKYLTSDQDAKDLSYALKIAINSVYGLTAIKDRKHKLRDPRNVDNWVAKRGALFMIDLMLSVEALGYTVIHCKTDSIKVLDMDDRCRQHIREFGLKYGYEFEVESKFDRICLVNDAVYICKHADDDPDEEMRGKWSATGKEFKVPYVFKMMFSHEPIEFEDLCEMKSVSTALYLDLNEGLPEGEHAYHFVGKTGVFCPIKPGCGGGILYREANDQFSAANGTIGYRWLESETVLAMHKEADIDESYYRRLVDKAIDKINKFGDYDLFVSDDVIITNDDSDELPWRV